MAYVGDVHAENHAPVLGVPDADRVVEVACVDRVDGDGEAVPNVPAVWLVAKSLIDVEANAGSLLAHCLGKLGTQPVLANSDFDLDAGIAVAAHDLLDETLCRVRA